MTKDKKLMNFKDMIWADVPDDEDGHTEYKARRRRNGAMSESKQKNPVRTAIKKLKKKLTKEESLDEYKLYVKNKDGTKSRANPGHIKDSPHETWRAGTKEKPMTKKKSSGHFLMPHGSTEDQARARAISRFADAKFLHKGGNKVHVHYVGKGDLSEGRQLFEDTQLDELKQATYKNYLRKKITKLALTDPRDYGEVKRGTKGMQRALSRLKTEDRVNTADKKPEKYIEGGVERVRMVPAKQDLLKNKKRNKDAEEDDVQAESVLTGPLYRAVTKFKEAGKNYHRGHSDYQKAVDDNGKTGHKKSHLGLAAEVARAHNFHGRHFIKHLQKQVKNGVLDPKYKLGSTRTMYEEIDLDEAMSIMGRVRAKLSMIKNKSKIKRGKAIAKRKVRGKDVLMRNARRQARNEIIRSWTKKTKGKMDYASRANIEKRLKKIPGKVAAKARKLYPELRKKEMKRKRS